MNNRIQKAEQFLLDSLDGGLAKSWDVISKRWVKPYPEVTGYLLSYFSQNHEDVPQEILAAAEHLINIQHLSGGFPCFMDKNLLFTFDTAQIMHGFASLYEKTLKNEYLDVAKKCAEFIIGMQTGKGSMFPAFDLDYNAKYADKNKDWGLRFSGIQAKNIEGLLLMYTITEDERYKRSAEKLAQYGMENCDLTFTHPGAYCLEGLLAAGCKDFVYEKLKEIISRIRPNGFIPYSENLNYAYVSGSVQIGILLFKTGFQNEARLILDWANIVQQNHNSGGLFQYANSDGTLNKNVHTEINTWGTKYYVQLEKIFENI
jgi:hypothetical protein